MRTEKKHLPFLLLVAVLLVLILLLGFGFIRFDFSRKGTPAENLPISGSADFEIQNK